MLNDDIIEAGAGFDMHPHSNFEIVTIVLEGAVEHQDSMGNKGTIHLGEIQAMSAGSGITHSEFNPSEEEKTKLLQIWVAPSELNITPTYSQKKFSQSKMKNKLVEVVSDRKGRGALQIHSGSRFLLGNLDAKKSSTIKFSSQNHGLFVFAIEGEVRVGDVVFGPRDAAAITQEKQARITALKKSKVLAIEVPLE